jgi:cytochrome c
MASARARSGSPAAACLALAFSGVSLAMACASPRSGALSRAFGTERERSVASASAALSAVRVSPALGRHATREEIAALDIDVAPDGAGLPSGRGTAAEGAAAYALRCAHCHGAAGEGGAADRLVGGVGSLTSAQPLLTTGSFWPYATTLFDYLRRAMPYDSPGTLSADEVYALTAFLLERNGVMPADARLDAATLPAVRMPNRDGFESAWPPGRP